MTENKKWLEHWQSNEYRSSKENNFNIIDNYINFTPTKILDIGCGLAFESELFYKKYKSDLFLLDGDFDNTKDLKRDVNYGLKDDFKFYSKINDLKKSFDSRGFKYTFVDANNISLEDDLKFDLVYSSISCGFHYPVDTYKNLIKKHTTADTVILMDIRKKNFQEQAQHFDVIKIVFEGKKFFKVHLKFKDSE